CNQPIHCANRRGNGKSTGISRSNHYTISLRIAGEFFSGRALSAPRAIHQILITSIHRSESLLTVLPRERCRLRQHLRRGLVGQTHREWANSCTDRRVLVRSELARQHDWKDIRKEGILTFSPRY